MVTVSPNNIINIKLHNTNLFTKSIPRTKDFKLANAFKSWTERWMSGEMITMLMGNKFIQLIIITLDTSLLMESIPSNVRDKRPAFPFFAEHSAKEFTGTFFFSQVWINLNRDQTCNLLHSKQLLYYYYYYFTTAIKSKQA